MAQTREQAIADLIREVAADQVMYTIERFRMGECYWQHKDDPAARQACAEAKFAATLALEEKFPKLAEALIGSAFRSVVKSADTRMGQSQFGGAPHVAADFEWPQSTCFTVADAAEDFEGLYDKSPVSLTDPLPLVFLAQIDLAELDPELSDLPQDGRLLVFMDYGTFFIDENKATTRIIWDRSDPADLVRRTPPPALVWLDELAKKEHGETGAWAATVVPVLAAKFGALFGNKGKDNDNAAPHDEEEKAFSSDFLPPETPVEMRPIWQHLGSSTIEVERSDYMRIMTETGAADIYGLDVAECPEDRADLNPPFHQILGQPYPEQSDPRYYAFFQKMLGRARHDTGDRDTVQSMVGLEGDAFEAHEAAEALKFRLLLELDIAGFMNMNLEGRFYFFVHEDDLEAGRFEPVYVVHQQT